MLVGSYKFHLKANIHERKGSFASVRTPIRTPIVRGKSDLDIWREQNPYYDFFLLVA